VSLLRYGGIFVTKMSLVCILIRARSFSYCWKSVVYRRSYASRLPTAGMAAIYF
jgi:hypothetical protein